MTSESKAQTNHENVLRNTGPKSPDGLRRASMNALKHGFTAKTFVIPGEIADEFEELHSEFLSTWSPANMIEADLVGQFAISTWIMRRVLRIEAYKFLEEDAVNKRSGRNDFPYFDKIIKYSAVYERRYYRAIHTLMQLRAARASEQTLSIAPDKTTAIEAPLVDSKAEENSKKSVPPHLETL